MKKNLRFTVLSSIFLFSFGVHFLEAQNSPSGAFTQNSGIVTQSSGYLSGVGTVNTQLSQTTTAGTVFNNPITISWAVNPSDETKFKIVRSKNNDTTTTKTIEIGSNVTNYVDTSATDAGIYTYTVQACRETECSNQSMSKIEVKDITAPIITRRGDATVTLPFGTPYVDAGATYTDNGQTFTTVLVPTGTVNVTNPGTYVLKYNVSDAAGNKATEVTRTVVVMQQVIATQATSTTVGVGVSPSSVSTSTQSASVVHASSTTSALITSQTQTNLGVFSATTTTGLTTTLVNATQTNVTPVLEKPAPPEITATTSSQNTIRLTWSDVVNETYYNVFRGVSSQVSTLLAKKDANVTAHLDSNLDAGSYIYSIEACNTAGCSSRRYSGVVTMLRPTAVVTTLPTSTSSSFITQEKVQNNTEVIGAIIMPSGELSKSIGLVLPYTYVSILDKGSAKSITGIYADKEGLFYVDLANGTYEVTVYKNSTGDVNTRLTKIVTMKSGKVESIVNPTVTLSKKVFGTITSLTNTPIFDAEVSAYNPSTGQEIKTTVTSTSTYSLNLYTGNWLVQVNPVNPLLANWAPSTSAISVSLANQSTDETRNVDFRVTPLDAKVNVQVTDEEGKPISSVGVILDPNSVTTNDTQTTERRAQYAKTDTNGVANFVARKGQYYIRTSSPDSLHYITPDEKSVSLSSNDVQTLGVVLKKETILNTVIISGNTTFDSGVPTSAFVSLWSEDGGHDQVQSGSDGNFRITIAKDDIWHIQANKDLEGKSYESTSLVIDTHKDVEKVTLTFISKNAEVLPPPILVQKIASDQVNIRATDGASFSLPPNSVTAAGVIDVQIKPTTEAPSHTSSEVISTVYDITVKNNSGTKLTKLSADAQIELPYNDENLNEKGITVNDLVPSYFDESIGTWVSVPKFTINTTKKVVVLFVDHLTRFALIAAADTTAPDGPINVTTDASIPNDVKITWSNPLKDLHHSKVYRSLFPGQLGDIVATEVYSSTFSDRSYVINGKTYYYTVRSIDAAGNESSNTDQIKVIPTASPLAVEKKSTTSLLPPGQVIDGQIVRRLSLGSKGDDVTALQQALKKDGFYATGPITGYFGKKTENAVMRFQNYYKEELLIPNGYKVGTGIVGAITRKKINEIISQ